MTADYSVDVTGFFEPAETDPVLAAVKRLLDEHADIVIKYVKMSMASHTPPKGFVQTKLDEVE